jgi:hypothetical protein
VCVFPFDQGQGKRGSSHRFLSPRLTPAPLLLLHLSPALFLFFSRDFSLHTKVDSLTELGMSLRPHSMLNSISISNWKDFIANDCSYALIRHDSLINYSRSMCREQLYCVMCGCPHGQGCEIPNQNKDVCKTCDSLVWKVERLNVVVKFCKGLSCSLSFSLSLSLSLLSASLSPCLPSLSGL